MHRMLDRKKGIKNWTIWLPIVASIIAVIFAGLTYFIDDGALQKIEIQNKLKQQDSSIKLIFEKLNSLETKTQKVSKADTSKFHSE